MSLSDKFKEFKRTTTRLSAQIRSLSKPRVPKRHRWNAIGRTRRKLAEILTAHVRTILGGDGKPRFLECAVAPEDIHPMRLAGKARIYEDAHSWEAYARFPDSTVCYSFMSYDTMTAIVRAGRVHPVGNDGEVGV